MNAFVSKMAIRYDETITSIFFMMNHRFATGFCTILLGLLVAFPLRAASWPASSQGTDIGASLVGQTPAFEPSGLVWHAGRGTLVAVGDEGQVAELRPDGLLLNYWALGQSFDLEDVTLADRNGSIVFLADENTSSALEFDLATGSLTGRSWSFASKISELNGAGLEGLTFVPDGAHTHGTTVSGGLFYAGWQYDGDIYVFESNLSQSGEVTFIEEIHMTSGYTDLSALSYDDDTKLVYALYDGLNLLEERSPNGTLQTSYEVPGTAQEGFAIIPEGSSLATAFVAQDTGGILAFAEYPIQVVTEEVEPTPESTPEPVPESTPVDADLDGVIAELDCNDNDSTVSSFQTYYLDQDGDGYGAGDGVSLCAASAPSGYASNNSDLYDHARIEIFADGTDNDGDASVDEYNTLAENGLHPIYRSFDPADTSAYGSYILAARGMKKGDIWIQYADGSSYQYDVFARSPMKKTVVSSYKNSGYFLVTVGNLAAVVNGYTGEVLATGAKGKYPRVLQQWVSGVVGF